MKTRNSKFEIRTTCERASSFRRRFRISNFEFRIFLLLLLPALSSIAADVTYEETIRPLFQDSCLNCHNADKHKAGLDLSSYDGTMDGSDNGKIVETGDADKSLLYEVLTHAAEPYMPKGGDKLTDAQLDMVRQWIEANAPEKAGGMIAKANSGPAVAVAPVEEKPQGPPAMPRDCLLEPVVHTARTGAVPSIAGSPWAPLVAIAAQKQVLLYNTDSLDLMAVFPFPEGFPAVVRFSHNGSLLIAGGGIGAKLGHVVIWDVVTGRRIAQIGDEFDTVLAADISPDQSLVALGGPSRLVKIFSASNGKMICKMKKHTDWVTALCFTPDGRELISGDRAGGLSVWDCQGHELQSVSAHTAGITGIACRGNLVATSSEDGTVKFWDIVEGKQTKSWHAHDGGVRSIAFTADGRIVTSGRDRLVRLWDANGAQVRQFEPLTDIAMQAAFAGGKIVAADWNGLVRVWTPDGKRAGDLDSNPPTIAQRLDTANKRLSDLQIVLSKARDAGKRAADTLATALQHAADAAAALQAKKSDLAAAQNRMAPLARQIDSVQKTQDESNRLGAVAAQLAWASAANPSLQPDLLSTLVARALVSQSLAAQKAVLAQSQPALAAARGQCAALAREVDARQRATDAAQVAVKSAEAALTAAQSTEDKMSGPFNAANLDLIKWRAAASRLASDPQYASRKTDSK